MRGQVWKPKIEQQEEQKRAKEESDRQWRVQQLFGSINGGGSTHGFDWSSMPKGMIWK